MATVFAMVKCSVEGRIFPVFKPVEEGGEESSVQMWDSKEEAEKELSEDSCISKLGYKLFDMED